MLFIPPTGANDVDPWKKFNVPFVGANPTQTLAFTGGPPVDASPWMPEGNNVFPTTQTNNPNTNGDNIQDPFAQGFDPFNLPMWNGPYAAPITQGQFSALEGMKKTVNADPIGQTNDLMAAISRMLAGSGFSSSGMDPNQAAAKFRPNTGFTQQLDEASKTGYQTMEGYDPTDTSKSNSILDTILSGGANANVDPRMKGFQDELLNAFKIAASAPRFDNTDLFKNMETVFENDLEKQTADLQEQFSGLGLGVGSTDRLDRIATNAGEARAKFRVGQGNLARESFENAEARRLGAVGTGGVVGNALNMGVENAMAALPYVMENERIPFAEKMEFVRSVLEPAAQRRMTATQTGVQTDENALDRVMQDRQMAEQARQAALQASIATRGQDIEQRGQNMSGATNLFNAESVFRNAADDEVIRSINEFARTQGGGLEQMLAFIQSLSPQDVAVGPSTVSQGAGVVGDIFSAIPGIIDFINSLQNK